MTPGSFYFVGQLMVEFRPSTTPRSTKPPEDIFERLLRQRSAIAGLFRHSTYTTQVAASAQNDSCICTERLLVSSDTSSYAVQGQNRLSVETCGND